MKNIIIFSAPRSGSVLLSRILSDAPNTINLGEFFSAGKAHVGKHLNNYIQYIHNEYALGLELYKPLMEKLSKLDADKLLHNDWIGINHQISQYLTVDILKAYLQFMENPNFLLKIFHQHYTNDNHIDIHALVDMFDVVIILYRENLIGHYISFERAMETKVWSKGNKKYRSNRMDFSRHTRSAAKNHKKPYDNKTKIKWNINKYIRYYNKLQKSYQSFEEISRLSGKPTVVIRYEDLDKQKDKYQYVQKILDDNNIDHKLIYSNEDPVLKQSVEGLPIEDNFLNPERFIKEFSEDSIPKSLQFKLSQ